MQTMNKNNLSFEIPVSIIVPVYNSEKYLQLSIDSILNQKFEKFELILIDDGSTDNSGIICEKYAKQDHRVVIVHTENRGSAMARNAGLDLARGEYIAFIDSDDYVDPYYIQELYDIIVKYHADIAFHDYYWFFLDSDITPEWHGKTHEDAEHKIYTRDEILFELCNNYSTNLISPCKMFKREIFNDLRFPNVRKNDDEWLVHRYFLKAEKVVYTNSQYYYVRFSPVSQTRGNISKDNFSAVLALVDRMNYLEKSGYEKIMKKFYERFLFSAIRFFNGCTEAGIQVFEEIGSIQKYLKKAYHKSGIAKRKETFSKRELLALYFFSHNIRVYKILHRKLKFTVG